MWEIGREQQNGADFSGGNGKVKRIMSTSITSQGPGQYRRERPDGAAGGNVDIHARPLPRWLLLVGSAGIAFHLVAVVIMVLAAQSGPFPTPAGPVVPYEPPCFVWRQNAGGRFLNDLATDYLQVLRLDNNYHFVSNKNDYSSVRFEVRLKDQSGDITTLKFPDENANFWVRHRQALLAQNLANDQPVQATNQNTVPAPGEQVARAQIWEQAKPGDEFQLHSVPVTSLSRDRPASGPGAWSQLLARAYVRHLISKHAAVSGELIRHSRNPIPPGLVITDRPSWPPNIFDEMVADFTERQP
jgi:hypothetical protein